MHDRTGRPLKKGDTVMIPAIITELSATKDFCNVSVETLYGRKPDDAKERISAINTNVLIKTNADD